MNTSNLTLSYPPLSIRDIDSIGYDETIAREIIFRSAEAKGCEVVVCKDDQIQLDIDRPWKYKESHTADSQKIQNLLGYIADSITTWVFFKHSEAWKSRGGNTHIVLTLTEPEKFTIEDRIVLQACLGSDPVRESLNLKRVKDGSISPIALFRPLESHP